MPNPFFNAMGNTMPLLGQLKANPLAMLQRAGFNVPANISSPTDIIQHLMNTGQLTQAQFDQAQMMAQRFGLK